MNSATLTTAKIPATKIEIVWSEAGENLPTFATFAAFDSWALGVVAVVDRCCKTEYRITFADGDTYTGRFDFLASSARTGLAAHLRNLAGIYAGHIIPAMCVGREVELASTLRAMKNDPAVYAMILDTYRIGDGDPTDGTANDNASAEAAALRTSDGRAAEEARIVTNAAAAHFQGSKYDRSRDVAETAKLIRKDLAAAGKTTTGPLAGCAFRVLTRRASMMVAIDVEIVSVPDHGSPIVNARQVEADIEARGAWTGLNQLSKRGESILATVQAIVDQYNFDKSDISSDYHHVGFYGGVRFGGAIEEAAREEIRRTLALLKQA